MEYLVEPQSPFLKFVPENQQTYFTKKITSMLQTDKQNVTSQNPHIEVNKMQIGQNQIDEYLIEVGDLIKLNKQMIRDLFKGLQKENKSKRVIIGLLGHKPLQKQNIKSVSYEKPSQNEKNRQLLNLNILLKLKPQEYPYASMFTCNCLMQILKLYIHKKTEFKEDDLSLRWKYDFFLQNQKIGQVLVFHDVKGDDLFANIAIRLKLGLITSNERQFTGDLLQQFGSRLNISKNLRESAGKIHQAYQNSLMYIGEQVLIKRRQPNKWQQIESGRFIRVNEVGHAILQGQQGNEEQIQDGYMQQRGNTQQFQLEQNGQQQKFQGIQI